MSLRTRIAAVAAASTVAVGLIAAAAPAQAAPVKVKLPVSGKTTIAKQNQSLILPSGSNITGDFDLASTTLTNGKLTIPDFTAKLAIQQLGPLGPSTSKVRIVATKPVDAKLDAAQKVTATTAIKINLRDVRLDALPIINLVQAECATKEIPLTLNSANEFDLEAAFDFSTKFTIPDFENCGPLGGLFNILISGPNNTLELKAGPIQPQ